MKFLIISIFIFLISAKSFATGQAGDRIILGKDTLQLLNAPFELILQQRNIGPNDLWGEKFDYNTACWRAYIATWKIENQKLYLIEIAPCNYYDYPQKKYPKVDLSKMFPDLYINGKIFANWVNDELLVADGELLYYDSNGFDRIYSNEKGLFFKDGLLLKSVDYDNSKTKISPYSQNEILLRDFIQSSIKWNEVKSEIDSNTKKVYCTIVSVNEYAKIDSISIFRSVQSEILNAEAVRVIKSIPEWDILYKKGKPVSKLWTLPVSFDKEMMKKYNN
ncbi:hypothetical protein MASR2M47_42240 [Draconibacterium sp.]|jgi:hypothetical protein